MKRLMFYAALALVLTGCSVDETGVRLLNAHGYDATCEIDAELVQSRGSLDISATTTYNLAFDVESDLTQDETTVGGTVLQPQNQNNFFVKEGVYSYTSNPDLSFNEERANAHYVASAGATEGGYITLNLIQPQAREQLLSSLAVGEELQLLVTVHLEGELGSGKKVKTNEVTFPIQVYNSGFSGCPGSTVAPTGAPCGNVGQDSGAGCCSNPSFAAFCSAT
jgi:hypothetical protein